MPTPSQAEYLAIDGIPLAVDGAWEWLDLSPLWQGAERRGRDRLVPLGTAGSGIVPYQRKPTATERAIEGYIYGFKDVNGGTFANVRTGLESNVAFLQEEIEENPGGNGTRVASLHMPSGAVRSGDVHVLGLQLGAFGPSAVRAVWLLSIPTGALSYAGS